jgi:tight adherence protein C
MTNLLPLFAVVLLIGMSAAFLWFGVTDRIAGGQRITRRLQTGTTSETERTAPRKINLIKESAAIRHGVTKYLAPDNETQTSRIRERLASAGYRGSNAVEVYLGYKWGIALVGFVIGVLVFAFTMNPAKPMLPVIAVLLIVMISFFATDMWVARGITYRKQAIERGFPDALDLLLVCIEAGHGLDQAIARVANEITTACLPLSEELKLAVAQLRAGRERERVMAEFADRTRVPDIKSFATVLRQADQFGVSIGDTLRVYASEMRNKRFMKAEEKANMMPVKLALGAIVFTVPPTIIILVGPSMIMVVRAMTGAAAG